MGLFSKHFGRALISDVKMLYDVIVLAHQQRSWSDNRKYREQLVSCIQLNKSA